MPFLLMYNKSMSEQNITIRKSPQENATAEESQDNIRVANTFFTIVTILLSYASLYEIFSGSALVSYSRLIPFMVLMAAHIALHWLSPRFSTSAFWRPVYIGLQAILGLSIVLISQSSTIALALFASLIAEQIGMIGFRRITVIAIIGFLGLTFLSYYLNGGLELVSAMTAPSVSTFVLLIVFMVMFRQQFESREHTQKLYRQLESTYEQLSESAAQIEELTLTTERQRLARELHDTLAQDMSGLELQLEAIKHHLGSGNLERIETIIDQAMKKARRTLADTRGAIDDLHLEVEAPSLRTVVRNKAERFTTSVGIPCHLDLSVPELVSVPYQIREHANRIIDEGLSNIAKHAQASQVWLLLEQAQGELRIELRDDGIGFDIESETPAGHYGLQGIQERADLVGGTVKIESDLEIGTTVKVVLPLKEPV